MFVGEHNSGVFPSNEEVSDYCYMGMDNIIAALQSHPEKFSAWFHIRFAYGKKMERKSRRISSALTGN